MKRFLLIVVLFVNWTNAISQNEARFWFFGNHAGIDFSTIPPSTISTGQTVGPDNSSTISDLEGQLLFYTDGTVVWNKNHQIMTNGTGLAGATSGGQCALIVPQPGTSLYYIFTVDQTADTHGLRYSIVDMSLQSGLGEITVKNTLLHVPTTEKLDAIANPYDNSYWVLTHLWNSDQFYCYKLTAQGLNIIPVISACGSFHTGGYPTGYNAMGQLTISPDGTKVVSTVYSDGTIDICDFDVITGQVSNARTITGYPQVWGAAFSPNSSMLYITRWKTDLVIQFDLTIDSLIIISGSANTIGHATSTNTQYKAGYLQLAPDNKIYVARFDMNYLAVINQPNLYGSACGFTNNGLLLASSTMSKAGLSRVALRSLTAEMPEYHINKPDILIFPNPGFGTFNLSTPVEWQGERFRLELFNQLGQLCHQEEFIAGINNVLNLSDLPEGIYHVEILNHGIRFASKQIIIAR